MKLASLSFNAVPRMPGFRPNDIMSIDTEKPNAFLGWRVSVRGQQVFFISPPGWDRDPSKKPRPNGPVTIFETSRAEVTFQWVGTAEEVDTLLKSSKFDSEPFGPPPEVVKAKSLLEQIPSSQIGDA